MAKLVSVPLVPPAERYVKVSAFFRDRGFPSREGMQFRKQYPELWPSRCIKRHTTFYAPLGELEAFLDAVARQEAAKPERFAEMGALAHRTPT